jgi:hypothetical protein
VRAAPRATKLALVAGPEREDSMTRARRGPSLARIVVPGVAAALLGGAALALIGEWPAAAIVWAAAIGALALARVKRAPRARSVHPPRRPGRARGEP